MEVKLPLTQGFFFLKKPGGMLELLICFIAVYVIDVNGHRKVQQFRSLKSTTCQWSSKSTAFSVIEKYSIFDVFTRVLLLDFSPHSFFVLLIFPEKYLYHRRRSSRACGIVVNS
jgi:hypothetical protein